MSVTECSARRVRRTKGEVLGARAMLLGGTLASTQAGKQTKIVA